MEDKIKKRIVGAVVLVFAGILVPFLLVQILQDPQLDEQAMRVYKITSSGEVEQIDGPSSADSPPADESMTLAKTEGLHVKQDQDAAKTTSKNKPDTQTQSNALESKKQHAQSRGTPHQQSASQAQPATQRKPKPEPESSPEPTQSEPGSTESTRTASQQTDTSQATASDSAGSETSGIKRSVASGAWVVQVASFLKENNARALAHTLGDHFDAYYTEAQIDDKSWYRVRIGPLESEAEANNKSGELRALGHKTLVLQID